jgi:thioredoxin reductase
MATPPVRIVRRFSKCIHVPILTCQHTSGIVLQVDERRQTSLPGIYAAGDLTTTFLPSVTQASSQGAMAGIFAQQSMLV